MVSHVIQKRHAGTQETHWVKTNKEVTSLKMVISFVCLIRPLRFLHSSMALLCHVSDHLQRADHSQ